MYYFLHFWIQETLLFTCCINFVTPSPKRMLWSKAFIKEKIKYSTKWKKVYLNFLWIQYGKFLSVSLLRQLNWSHVPNFWKTNNYLVPKRASPCSWKQLTHWLSVASATAIFVINLENNKNCFDRFDGIFFSTNFLHKKRKKNYTSNWKKQRKCRIFHNDKFHLPDPELFYCKFFHRSDLDNPGKGPEK